MRIWIEGGDSFGLDYYNWNVTQGGTILSGENGDVLEVRLNPGASSIAFTVCAVDYETGTIYQSGGGFPASGCSESSFWLIYPNPVNKNSNELVSIVVADDYVMDEIQQSGTPLAVFILGGIDGSIIHSFETTQKVSQVNVSQFNPGFYSVFTTLNGNNYSGNFIIVEN